MKLTLGKRKINTLNLLICGACLVIICMGLQVTKMIFVPLFISFVFSTITNPIADYCQRRVQFPRYVYSILILLFAIFMFLFFGGFFLSSLNQVVSELDGYIAQINNFSKQVILSVDSLFPEMKVEEAIKKEFFSPIVSLIGFSSSAINTFLQVSLLSFICSLFLIFEPFTFKSANERETRLYTTFQNKVRRYVLIKAAMSILTSLIIIAYLSLIGQKYLFFIGLTTFVLNFIPSFGSIFATALLVPILGIEVDNTSGLLLLLVFPATTQFIIGNILEPKFMGDSLKLGSIVVVFSLIFWGIIFGVYGLFLAVPLTLAVDTFRYKMNFKKYLLVDDQ